MHLKVTGLLFVAALGLSACMGPTNDVERGVVGAAAGATAAHLTGYDPLAGAAAGATAGVLCDNVGACR